MTTIEEDLKVFESKLNTLKLDYERYFLGTRPREPLMARREIQKFVVVWANQPIQNTACRFKFNSVNSRYQALKRQWDSILRQMEAGTYKRDVFKANIRQRVENQPPPRKSVQRGGAISSANAGANLIDSYREAAQACGQNIRGVSAEKLQSVVDKQTATLREKMGCSDVSFRVVVQDGKVKLKASPIN